MNPGEDKSLHQHRAVQDKRKMLFSKTREKPISMVERMKRNRAIIKTTSPNWRAKMMQNTSDDSDSGGDKNLDFDKEVDVDADNGVEVDEFVEAQYFEHKAALGDSFDEAEFDEYRDHVRLTSSRQGSRQERERDHESRQTNYSQGSQGSQSGKQTRRVVRQRSLKEDHTLSSALSPCNSMNSLLDSSDKDDGVENDSETDIKATLPLHESLSVHQKGMLIRPKEAVGLTAENEYEEELIAAMNAKHDKRNATLIDQAQHLHKQAELAKLESPPLNAMKIATLLRGNQLRNNNNNRRVNRRTPSPLASGATRIFEHRLDSAASVDSDKSSKRKLHLRGSPFDRAKYMGKADMDQVNDNINGSNNKASPFKADSEDDWGWDQDNSSFVPSPEQRAAQQHWDAGKCFL